MKFILRTLVTAALAIFFALTEAHAQAKLELGGIAAAPGSVQPGQNVQFTITVNNVSPVPLPASTANDFNGGTVNVGMKLSSLSANPIVLGSATVTLPAITAGGAGTAVVNYTVPANYSQAASYFAVGEIRFAQTGTPATATTTIKGRVSAINMVNSLGQITMGSNYSSAPAVTISAPAGTGTTATAKAILAGGAIIAIDIIDAGSGYTSAPTVGIGSDPTGTGAVATAEISASVSGYVVPGGSSGSGSGYTTAPSVYVKGYSKTQGGGGNNAAAGPVTVSGGAVTAIAQLSGGQDYQTPPTVEFVGGGPVSVGSGSIQSAFFTTATQVVTVTGSPDLLITSVNYPANVSYKGGDVIPMSLTYTDVSSSNGVPNVPFHPTGGTYFRIQIVLSNNPTFGDADDFQLTFLDVPVTTNADDKPHTFSWNQLLPGNFPGSYYVLARIDSLKTVNESVENDPAQNGNNDWLDVAGTRIAILPTTFPTMSLASVATTGTSGNGASDNPSISADGRYIVFASKASNLVSASSGGGADTNNVSDIFLYDNQTSTTRRLNLSQQGAQADAESTEPFIAAAGRYVAFSSNARNLVFGDNNVFRDIFVVDTITGAISLESVATNPSGGGLGTQANGDSFKPSLSSDGQWLVFQSSATNLVTTPAVPANGAPISQIYLRNRTTGVTTLVSQSSTGVTPPVAGNGSSIQAAISADGKYVAFASIADNLLGPGGDTNGLQDVFLRDLTANTTIRVSVGPGGLESVTSPIGGDSRAPSISADGRYIAFSSDAPNLLGLNAGNFIDNNQVSDVFVFDRVNSTTKRVSVSSSGTQATDPSGNPGLLGSFNPFISATGRFVTFASLASNLAPGDAAGRYGTLAAATLAGTTVGAVNITNPGVASGSAFYTSRPGVKFSGGGGSGATAVAVLSNDSEGYGYITGFNVTNPGSGYQSVPTVTIIGSFNAALNIYVADRAVDGSPTLDTSGNIATTLVSVNKFGYQTTRILGVQSTAAADIYPVISADGRWVAMPSDTESSVGLATTTTNLLSNDSNGARDVFLHDRRTNSLPNPNSPPVVTITSPGTGSTALVNTVIAVQASATAARVSGTIIGVVANVQFFVNGTSLGTTTVFPYTANWTPTAVGNYTLSAIVTDSFGNVGVSPNVVVSINATPSVGLTSPLAGAQIILNTATTLTATAGASNPGGSIASVEFFANGVSIGTGTTTGVGQPYQLSWTPTGVGSYALTAVATENTGSGSTTTQTTSTPITVAVVSVSGGGNPINVALTSPLDNSLLPVNTPQRLSATANAVNGVVVGVRFLANGVEVANVTTFPFTTTWTPVTPGLYTLIAKATDNTGSVANSAPIHVSIGVGTPAAVSIASPTPNASIPVGSQQTIVANATAGSGTIVSVQFFANGTSLGTDTTFPYNQTWTPAGVGPVELTAVATDSLGNRTTSPAVSVTVAVTSVTSPAVSIVNPSAGSSVPVGVTTTVSAIATDPDGTITKVEFFANGALLGTDTSYPYSVSFSPTATGRYTLTAVATDDGGNTSTSVPVLVTVAGGSAPAAAIISPDAGTTLEVNVPQVILASASSPSGVITSVDFLVNGTAISTKTTFPYSATWTPSAVGIYSLTVRATDNFGNTTDSAPVVLSVSAGSPTLPKVALTSLPSGIRITANHQVFISANASDPDGFVTNVEFYVNDRLVGSKATAPYYAVWVPSTVGTYTVKATVTDDAGNRVTSAPSTITTTTQVGAVPVTGLNFNNPAVNVVANPPAIDPTVPVKVDYGSKLIIGALAVKDDGTITNVQFFANGVSIGSLTAAPYFTIHQLDTLSDVVLTALVTDSAGNTVFTNPILIDTQPATDASNAIVTLVSPLDGSTYVNGGQIIFSATHNFGTVVPPKIDFYIDGQQFTTVTTATGGSASSPYQYIVGLARTGTYIVHAVGRSDTETTVSAPARITVTSSRAPSVNITSPAVGTTYTVGTGLTIAANASSSTGLIQNVQFFVNGAALSTKNTTPYTAAWNPGAAGTYTITALATDDSGNQTLSAPVVLTLVSNGAPTVSITNPASGTNANAGSIVNLVAAAADADGTVASVRFLANGTTVGSTATAAPFSTSWTPSAAGTYSIIAQATDNSGNVTNSAPITLVVSGNRAPTVALVTPSNGSVVRAGSSSTITANASDVDGTIASVQFFANGVAVGSTLTALPYRVQWTPTAEGVYRLTAVAIDNAGATTTSPTLTVLVVTSGSAGADNIYTGDYSGNGEIGRFAVVTVRGKTAAFIGYSTTTVVKTYFYSGLPVDGNGGFVASDGLGRTLLTVNTNDTGLSGTMDNGRIIAIGINSGLFPATRSIASGYYSGNLTGRPASTLAAIVGADGTITIYVADGTFQTAGSGSVDTTGAFTINTSSGNRFTGKADPATGFLTGTLSGNNGGPFMAATSSGLSFSDGFLRNLSTRGQVGTGSNILIAGFVVGGSLPKQILVRAIGPTLTSFGLTGVLADPQLQLFNSSNALIVTNNNWGGASNIVNAANQVGAFPLAAASLDSVVLATLAPGAYTAQVSGVGNTTGVALIELYDVDTLSPFSSQKVMNVATRGVVGADQGQLIAGFVVSGNTPKKVLVRAVGPTLAAAPFNLAGVLTDPILRLVRSDNVVVRENDNWESGNDAALVTEAAVKVGAFPLAAGGKDAAILINLPPGTYNAQATGAGTSTGVALIEVYEVP